MIKNLSSKVKILCLISGIELTPKIFNFKNNLFKKYLKINYKFLLNKNISLKFYHIFEQQDPPCFYSWLILVFIQIFSILYMAQQISRHRLYIVLLGLQLLEFALFPLDLQAFDRKKVQSTTNFISFNKEWLDYLPHLL